MALYYDLPVFERQFIFHTYACRKGKGSHKAENYAFKKARTHKYFLNLDVKITKKKTYEIEKA